MKCPNCGKDQDRILDTRYKDNGSYKRRVRECKVCGRRFVTKEIVILDEREEE